MIVEPLPLCVERCHEDAGLVPTCAGSRGRRGERSESPMTASHSGPLRWLRSEVRTRNSCTSAGRSPIASASRYPSGGVRQPRSASCRQVTSGRWRRNKATRRRLTAHPSDCVANVRWLRIQGLIDELAQELSCSAAVKLKSRVRSSVTALWRRMRGGIGGSWRAVSQDAAARRVCEQPPQQLVDGAVGDVMVVVEHQDKVLVQLIQLVEQDWQHRFRSQLRCPSELRS